MGLVDDAHAAAANLADDPVIADLFGGGFHHVLSTEGTHRPQVVRRDVELVETVEVGRELGGEFTVRGQKRMAIGAAPRSRSARYCSRISASSRRARRFA